MKGKRLLAMLLAVMMIVTALPVGIFAEEEQAELPGAGFFSAPEYTAEYYVGTDLPFTGRNQDADGGAYEVYYYLKRSDDLVENVTVLNIDGEADTFVTVELVDG